ITKSMTATLAATMVEDGLIQWETTLGSVFPEKVGAMSGEWANVTLKQLLANASGAPNNLNSSGIWNTLWNFNGLPRDGRLLLLDELTPQPLRFAPATGYEYSNAGFALAGLMLEEVANSTWEDLMRERLFEPLGMKSGGFGVPATPRHLDHPVGHGGTVGNPTIFDPAANADNPPAIGPAATAHASILDLARYAQAHLRGDREGGPVLPKATWEFLHTQAFGNSYALGWNVLNRSWAGGDALTHTGSNTQWYTNIWIAPEVNWACIVCTNFGGTNAFQMTDQVILWAINNHGP
ncbi:MAG TPA: serine hydrolase domain-containing protein, partial [Oceanipulchritudo sp.]|nr:serine hydrolase domain-containing protein [Oceanipulchritudo sp.]